VCEDDECTYPGHEEGHQAAHPLYTPFTDYAQLLEWRDGDILMDEVTGIASSRESASMPVQVANYLVQLRRRNVSLSWSSPAWGRSDKIIREVTQAVSLCMGYVPKRRPPVPGEPPRLWSDRRLFYVRTYDAMLMDDFDSGAAEGIPHIAAAFYWRPGGMAENSYDTLDPVTALGWANEAGLCMVCGGKRTHPKCGCVVHRASRAEPDEGGGGPKADPPSSAGLAAVLDIAQDRANADAVSASAAALTG
jgi:hypothetical protein